MFVVRNQANKIRVFYFFWWEFVSPELTRQIHNGKVIVKQQ